MVVHGKKYTASNIHKLPEDINGFAATSKTDDNTLAFFGELNPFSNFHITPFELNGKSYHSSEQYIQEAKALFFKDNLSAKLIMDAKTPLECKKLSREITGYNHEEWKLCAKEQCKPGIAAKFSSSSALIQLLHSTGDKMIIEACHDQLWGTGISIRDKDCLNREKWSGAGILGEILMELRTDIPMDEDP